jgi:aryl carrier-like protein
MNEPPGGLLSLIEAGYRQVARRPAPPLGLEDDVQAVGLDSVQVLELVVWLEDSLGVDVSFEQMSAVRTLEDLIRALQDSGAVHEQEGGPR